MRAIFLILNVAAPLALFCAPAQAQATRTWVSGVGDDANPCSRTAPCKTFAGAISKTAAAGEINVLDPGGFGAVTVTKSITISSEGFEAGVLVSGTNGIVISAAASDKIKLKGLDIEGLGTGLDGVRVLSSSNVFIHNCSIRGFSGNGVNVNSAGPGVARVFIEDSQIGNNNVGVNVAPTGGTAGVFIERTVVDRNVTSAAQLNALSTILANFSTFTGSPNAISFSGGGTFTSTGNNLFIGAGLPNSSTALH
jgi:hypothetical protein